MKTRVTTIGFLCLFAFALDCTAQTVADIARKERERQKRLHSTVVVAGGVTTPTSAATSTNAASTNPAGTSTNAEAPKPVGPVDNKGRDEKYWRTEFQKARDTLKKAEDNAQLLDLKVKQLNTQLLRQSDMYNREYRLGPEITDTQKQLDDAHKQVDEANKRISDLEDELRRSGGPPGWAR